MRRVTLKTIQRRIATLEDQAAKLRHRDKKLDEIVGMMRKSGVSIGELRGALLGGGHSALAQLPRANGRAPPKHVRARAALVPHLLLRLEPRVRVHLTVGRRGGVAKLHPRLSAPGVAPCWSRNVPLNMANVIAK